MDIRTIERPSQRLLTYYLLSSFALGPLFFLALVPRLVRFYTLRYRFDEEGVSASWGKLFRREVHLAYDRIQDIHLRSNVVERWLSLARIEIQTASGSAKAELTIEGIESYEEVRDYLYSQMRGVDTRSMSPAFAAREPAGETAELGAVLSEIAAELRALRVSVEAGNSASSQSPHG